KLADSLGSGWGELSFEGWQERESGWKVSSLGWWKIPQNFPKSTTALSGSSDSLNISNRSLGSESVKWWASGDIKRQKWRIAPWKVYLVPQGKCLEGELNSQDRWDVIQGHLQFTQLPIHTWWELINGRPLWIKGWADGEWKWKKDGFTGSFYGLVWTPDEQWWRADANLIVSFKDRRYKEDKSSYQWRLSPLKVGMDDSLPNLIPMFNLNAEGSVERGSVQWIDGEALANDFPVKTLLGSLGVSNEVFNGGRVSGWGKGTYSLDSVFVEADFVMRDLTINNEGGFWAILKVFPINDVRGIGWEGSLGKEDRLWGKLQGFYRKLDDSLKVIIRSDSLPLEGISMLLHPKRTINGVDISQEPLLKGFGRGEFILTGRQGIQSGKLSFKSGNGYLGPIPFEELQLSVRFWDLDREDALVEVEDIRFTLPGTYASVSGTLKLKGDKRIALMASVSGDFMKMVEALDPDFFSHSYGDGSLNFSIGGTLDRPRLLWAKMRMKDGRIRFKEVIGALSSLLIDISVDSSRKVTINRFTGDVDGAPFFVFNRFPESEESLKPLIIEGFNLGVIQFTTTSEGLRIVMPGFMDPNWSGHFIFTGQRDSRALEFSGPAQKPQVRGRIILRNAMLTYPLIGSNRSSPPSLFVQKLLHILETIWWDIEVVPIRGCRYLRTLSAGVSGLVSEKARERLLGSEWIELGVRLDLDLKLDDSPQGIKVRGSLKDTLTLEGEISCTRGNIRLLDLAFSVRQLSLRFVPPDLEPVLQGEAWTVIIDSLTREQSEVRLKLSGQSREEEGLSHLYLTLENDRGDPPGKILEQMGYTPEQLPARIGLSQLITLSLVVKATQQAERWLEKMLGLDIVELQLPITRNVLSYRLYSYSTDTASSNSFNYISALYGSRLLLGRYLTPDLFLSYSSILSGESGLSTSSRVGLVHTWDALLRLKRLSTSFSLNFRYEYDGLTDQTNSNISLRYFRILDLERLFQRSYRNLFSFFDS
ncbi:MAG: translocation/assembly module TamB domain-containing protein, partial [bacterium]